jgi:dTDP-4-amino-4,6-dideoxygalactose transaminase
VNRFLKVPLLDLQLQNAGLAPQLTEAFQRVLKSGQFIGGPEVESFEKSVAARVGVPHAIGVSSGTDAILLALMALEIGPGDEVICPSFTFFATGGCIARVGATPVFADSCADSFNIDVEDARRRVTAKTKAIIAVHLFGQCAGMDGVMALARDHGLAVIEDAAQALGAEYKGRQAGSIGTFGVFSFYPSKNLGACGDAGMLTATDGDLAAKARLLRNHGAEQRYFHRRIGGNFRLDPLQAALLAVKLEHLESYTERRERNAQYYTSKLRDTPGIALPAALPCRRHIWNQYTLRVPSRRNALKEFLTSRGIGSEVYYPRALHQQECFRHLAETPPRLPVSEQLAEECISIPIYPELTREQLDAVIEAVAGFLQQGTLS